MASAIRARRVALRLSRFADIILDGIEVPATEGPVLHEWRDAIRTGTALLELKGYSHVFVHTQQPGDSDPSERTRVSNVRHAWQEIYGRDRLRQLVLAYNRNESPRTIRASLGDDEPWGEGVPSHPSPRVIWTAVPRSRGGTPSKSGTRVAQPAPSSSTGGGSEKGEVPPGTTEGDKQPRATQPQPSSPPVAESTEFAWATPTLRRVLMSLATNSVEAVEEEAWLRESVDKLRTALLSYNLQARVLGSRLTPNTALVRFQGSDRLRTTDVESRRDELLTTHGLQITNILSEPGQVVIAVARKHRRIVGLVDVWRDRKFDRSAIRSNQVLVVGVREADGDTLYLAPGEAHAPHTLIAGTTGSGKSVLIQNLLLDIAATNGCADARIILIDPKQGADYLDLQELPHIQGGIVVSQEVARTTLESVVTEMERRYELFRAAGVANLARYNARVPLEKRQPVIWLIHDEFAVWMLVDDYKETVSNTVQRLGVMARAAGIFLIFAAQRPEDRVMPVQLRDNLGNRLVLRVESPGTSKISLGEEGAERLLGKGHLAARLQGEDRVIFAQVPILTSDQMREIVSAVARDTNPIKT